MKPLNFLDKFLFFINSLLAILLLLTYALPYIDPERLSGIAILSLVYPILLIANLIFVVLWVIKLKLHFLVSLMAILLGFSHLNAFYSFDKKEVLKQSDVKLLSYNVRQFNSQRWIKSPTIKQDICNFVNQQKPDIVFFQEYKNEQNVQLNIPKVLDKKTGASGLAIYAKYKAVHTGSINFKNTSNNIAYVDLKIQSEIIRFYNVHIQSFSLDTNKNNYGNKNSKALMHRFQRVFKQQSHQIKTLKAHIAQCPYRSIVAGDFNNTAFSWNYHTLIKNRIDAFVEAGMYFGKTYKHLFPFRIDFILPESSMNVGSFTTFNVNLSDHFPIMARINLNH